MREDDGEFGRYLPLLRRIIILVAIITAVPVILWTITAFVRAYVAPAQLPTFHQLAASASSKFETRKNGSGQQQSPAADVAKLPEPASPVETKASGDETSAAKGDRAAESDAAPAATAAINIASGPTTVPANPKGAEMFPPPQTMPSTAKEAATLNATVVTAPPPMLSASVSERAAEVPIDAHPLSGPIPLPRHRPRDLGAERIADISAANIPVPRPRPDAAGAAAPAEEGGGSPLGFIQNLFH